MDKDYNQLILSYLNGEHDMLGQLECPTHYECGQQDAWLENVNTQMHNCNITIKYFSGELKEVSVEDSNIVVEKLQEIEQWFRLKTSEQVRNIWGDQ